MATYGVITDALQKLGDPSLAPGWLPWRLGKDVRNVFLQVRAEPGDADQHVGHMATAALAEEVVRIHNLILQDVQAREENEGKVRQIVLAEQVLTSRQQWRARGRKVYLQPRQGQNEEQCVGTMRTERLADEIARAHNLVATEIGRRNRRELEEWEPERVEFHVRHAALVE